MTFFPRIVYKNADFRKKQINIVQMSVSITDFTTLYYLQRHYTNLVVYWTWTVLS